LLNLSVNDGKTGKIEIVEQICQKIGKNPVQHTEKFLIFLRKNLNVIEASSLPRILPLLNDQLSNDLQKMFNLVVKT